MSLLLGRLLVVGLTCGSLFGPLCAMAPDQEPSTLPQDILLEPALVPRIQSLQLKVRHQAPRDVVAESHDQNGPGHIHSQTSELEGNCSDPAHPEPKYNSSCEYVLQECSIKVHLINYLELVYCKMAHVKVIHVQVTENFVCIQQEYCTGITLSSYNNIILKYK